MLNADVLTFQEFAMHEPLPLSKIQGAVLEFLQGRDDAVLFGAQAVNAYVSEPRATQDVDIISTRAIEFAEELREHLSETYHIAIRVREVGGRGLRLYQVRKEGNRHLVDVRIENTLPATEEIEKIRVLTPVELIVSKVISYQSRRGKPKSGTDWRDLAMLLVRFPELKVADGDVGKILLERNVDENAVKFWNDLVQQDFSLDDEDDDLSF
ncbi:MAG: nucleotidyl transferase AbiEii/AbiGii toxin family protein [Pyrinomonadaceae bacterium]